MDIRKLETFLVLCECKNFSEAANILYCSQPAVSKQIQSLENILQVPLFDRVGRRTFLTVQGEYFKPYAEEMVNVYLSSKEHIQQLENINEGTITFGATNFIGVYLVPQILSIFLTHYPQIKINMIVDNSKALLKKLDGYELEFLFLSDYIDVNLNKCQSRTFADDELVLICGADHPLAEKEYCTPEDLAGEVLIGKGSKSSQLAFIKRILEKHNYIITHELQISNQEGIKQAVLHNLGVAIMSSRTVEIEKKAGLIKTLRFQEAPLTRKIMVVNNSKRTLTPATKKFLSLL